MKFVKDYSTQDLPEIAGAVLDLVKKNKILLLEGDLGAGKTTLVNEMLKSCGTELGSSPTFSLVNEYETELGLIYHLDLYRVEEEEELYDFGIEEMLDSGNIVIMEWPQIAMNLLTSNYVYCNIEHLSEDKRRINTQVC